MPEQKKSFLLKGDKNIGILLLHGWSSPTAELLPLGKYLNSLGYTVYAPLFSGHGTRPEDLLGVTWQDWLCEAKEGLERLKKENEMIFVGGISMGGNLAMLVSGDPKVKGIISFGPSVRFRFHNLAKISLFFMGLTKTYRKKYFPPWIKKVMGERVSYEYYPVSSAKEVMKMAEFTRLELSAITKPILIMQSTIDHMVSKKSPRIILENVKSEIKEIVWVKNRYHVFITESGEEKIFEKVAEFIERVAKL